MKDREIEPRLCESVFNMIDDGLLNSFFVIFYIRLHVFPHLLILIEISLRSKFGSIKLGEGVILVEGLSPCNSFCR